MISNLPVEFYSSKYCSDRFGQPPLWITPIWFSELKDARRFQKEKTLNVNWNLKRSTKQGSRVNCLVQTGSVVFINKMQLISVFPYAETKQLSQLTW